MLKKEFRIRKQKDFENVFAKGAYFSGRLLILKAMSNDLSVSRFGFVVSNKISKKAVERNRAKRLTRESVRLLQENIKPGFDVVFVCKKEIKGEKFEKVKEAVERLLKRSGLLVK